MIDVAALQAQSLASEATATQQERACRPILFLFSWEGWVDLSLMVSFSAVPAARAGLGRLLSKWVDLIP